MQGRILTPLASSGTRLTATVIFTPDFSGLVGHFPDHPVVPGFCQLEACLALHQGAPLASIQEAKLTRPLLPNELAHITLLLSETYIDAELTLPSGDRISRFRFTLQNA